VPADLAVKEGRDACFWGRRAAWLARRRRGGAPGTALMRRPRAGLGLAPGLPERSTPIIECSS